MNVRGRKPKPTATKEREGNPGKRALPKGEPKGDPLPVDFKPPEFIGSGHRRKSVVGRYGQKLWKKLGPELISKGILTTLDVMAFTRYCVAYNDYMCAEARIVKDGRFVKAGSGGMKTAPWVYESRAAEERMRKLEMVFGLTPADRARVTTDPDEVDEFEEWSKGNGKGKK